MDFKQIGLFLTVIAFTGFLLTCGVMIVDFCSVDVAVCFGALSLPSSVLLPTLISVVTSFLFTFEFASRLISSSQKQSPLVFTITGDVSQTPIFRLHEVYRL